MRSLLLACLTVCLAAGLASAVSLFVASAEAEPEPEVVSQGSIATRPQVEVSEGPSPGYSQVVDNATEGRFEAPGWGRRSGGGHYGGDYAYAGPSEDVGPASFKFDVPKSGRYSVYARWPADEGNAGAARFGISTVSGIKWTEVDQRTDGGMWIRLGAYEMEAGDRQAVQVSSGAVGDGEAVADAVMILSGEQANPEAAPQEEAGTTLRLRIDRGRVTNSDIIRRARSHLGTRYRNSPPYPCKSYRMEDCSCHTRVVFKSFGKRLPENPVAQWKYGNRVKRAHLHPGDLVYFDENRNGKLQPWDHVGIYSGNGNLIHASSYFGKVVERKMKYIRGYWGAKRLNLR